jgi:ABC-type arginine transport system ATPase subunit
VARVNTEKKQAQARQDSAMVPKAIRLRPSVTDYATYVATTSKVLGTTGPAAQKTKPNMRLLSLANFAS